MDKKKRGGDITKLSDLFEVYKQKLYAPQSVVIKTFQEVVQDLLGVEIPKDQCSYTPSTKTIGITTSGVVKTEILMRKEEILAHIKGRMGEKNTPTRIV